MVSAHEPATPSWAPPSGRSSRMPTHRSSFRARRDRAAALGFTYIRAGEEDRKPDVLGRAPRTPGDAHLGGRAAEIEDCSRVSTGALDDIQRARDPWRDKAVAEYGLSASLGPMSVSTLSSGGNDDALFGGGVADGANRAVEKEVKDTLTSALWIAVGLVDENLRCLDEIGDELSETEKVSGDWLQKKLDEVVATPDLERFLRGHTPQPPEGSKVWENLPLPAFRRRRRRRRPTRGERVKKNGVRRRRETVLEPHTRKRPCENDEGPPGRGHARDLSIVPLAGVTTTRHPRNSPRHKREIETGAIVKLGQKSHSRQVDRRFGICQLEHVRSLFSHTRTKRRLASFTPRGARVDATDPPRALWRCSPSPTRFPPRRRARRPSAAQRAATRGGRSPSRLPVERRSNDGRALAPRRGRRLGRVRARQPRGDARDGR